MCRCDCLLLFCAGYVVLSACACHVNVQAYDMLQRSVRVGAPASAVAFEALVKKYARMNDIESAREMMELMKVSK